MKGRYQLLVLMILHAIVDFYIDWEKHMFSSHELEAQSPQRTISTYKRLISLAIAERDLHKELTQSFRLCIPHKFIPGLAVHFPEHSYAVIGGCFQDHDAVYVTWIPSAQRKNH